MSDTDVDSAFWASVLDAPYKTYWESLGRFIAEFSATERALLVTIKEMTNLETEIGSAILGGVRVHDGISLLNRILDAANRPRAKKRLDNALWQLGQINTTRNNIIHWGAELVWETEGVFLVSNKHLIHSKQIPQEYTVTPDELRNMATDLVKIRIHLAIEGGKDAIPRSLYQKALRKVLQEPWTYKPPQRGAPPPRSRGKSRKQQSPPPAS